VYRTLQALAGNGILDVLRNDEGEAIYRRCITSDHHHHLVCRSCGRSVEIASDKVESWAARTARRHGYTSVTHTVEVYGLCRECS
jgi:Fur family transcriptional regulator, ferric uptake regulator